MTNTTTNTATTARTITTSNGATFTYTEEVRESEALLTFLGELDGEPFHGDLYCWRERNDNWSAKVRDPRGNKCVATELSRYALIRRFVGIMTN